MRLVFGVGVWCWCLVFGVGGWCWWLVVGVCDLGFVNKQS